MLETSREFYLTYFYLPFPAFSPQFYSTIFPSCFFCGGVGGVGQYLSIFFFALVLRHARMLKSCSNVKVDQNAKIETDRHHAIIQNNLFQGLMQVRNEKACLSAIRGPVPPNGPSTITMSPCDTKKAHCHYCGAGSFATTTFAVF